jgi:hypothetical protein
MTNKIFLLLVRSICPSDLTQRVPSQYIHVYGDKCYEFVPYAGSWMHARTDCHRKGGHMLSITNAGEQAFISNLISKGYVITKLWLGLDDRVNEGHFNWDTGNFFYIKYMCNGSIHRQLANT